MSKRDDKSPKNPVDIDAELEAMDAQLASGPDVPGGEAVTNPGTSVASRPKVSWPSDKVAVPPPAPTKYRVLAKRTLSVEGRLVRLNVGDIVSADGYGPVAVEHILSGGVLVEEIKS